MTSKVVTKHTGEGRGLHSRIVQERLEAELMLAPVRLPPKVVAAAKYVSMGIALLDALSGRATSGKEEPDDGT